MVSAAPEISIAKHRLRPPCHCRDCIIETDQADHRRAEIQAIIDRLDRSEQMIGQESLHE